MQSQPKFTIVCASVLLCVLSCSNSGTSLSDDNGSLSSATEVAMSSSSFHTRVSSYGLLIDNRDGQRYKTVLIGTQIWMAENLNYSGDNRSGARTYTKGWCFGVGDRDTTQHRDSSTCDFGYGRLYNWTDAVNINDYNLQMTVGVKGLASPWRGLCPIGWHVPMDAEWDTLSTTIQIANSATADTEGKYLKAVVEGDSIWNNRNVNAQNMDGFLALPTGERIDSGPYGAFWSAREGANFWSATEYMGGSAKSRILSAYNARFDAYDYHSKADGLSLRCLKDVGSDQDLK